MTLVSTVLRIITDLYRYPLVSIGDLLPRPSYFALGLPTCCCMLPYVALDRICIVDCESRTRAAGWLMR